MSQGVFMHELVRCTRQARFWICSVAAVGLLALSADRFAEDLKLQRLEAAAAKARFREAIEDLEYPAELRQIQLEFTKQADVAAWLTHGREKRIPSTVYLNLIEGKLRGEHLRVKNLLARHVALVDWVFVVTFCLTLGAVMQGADLVAGESEEGTLRLALANPVSRAAWLTGKIGGTWAALALPTLVAGLFSLLVLLLRGITLEGPTLALLIAAYAYTLLALLVFLLASAWASCALGGRSAALVGSLMIWLALALVLPGMSRGAAEMLQPAASPEEIEQTIQELRGGSALATQRDMDRFVRQRALLQADFFKRLERQISIARRIELFSPLAAFESAAETLADSGWPRHRRFLAEIERQMQLFWEIAGERSEWQAYPEIDEARPAPAQRLLSSLRVAVILLCQAGVLLAGTLFSLARMDIS